MKKALARLERSLKNMKITDAILASMLHSADTNMAEKLVLLRATNLKEG